jgi:gamma-glutamylcyclotransferase (GGCT)/AIG2-like uncharacterized protein YtfP
MTTAHITSTMLRELESTSSSRVRLFKNGIEYVGIYNGLSYWGHVYDFAGNRVQKLQASYNEEYDQLSDFAIDDFILSGYTVENY